MSGQNKKVGQKAVVWKKIRLLLLGNLLLGIVMTGGCGSDNGAGERDEGTAEQADRRCAWQEEENSLARWKASLQEGAPEELTAEAFRGVSVVKDETTCFAVSYEPRAYKNSFDCWAVSVPYQSMVTVDTEAMYEYFYILEELKLTPTDGLMREEAGIEDTYDSIFVAYYSGQTAEGGQAEPDRGITFYFGDKDENGNYYVEAGGKIWSADKTAVEKLFAVNPYEYILKVVSVVNLETVSGVTVTFGDKQYEMETDGRTFWCNEETVDSTEFYELYTELMSIFTERELSREEREKMNVGDRELLMRVVYKRNREDAPEITQCYYAFDESYASVQVNGTEFFLVSREALRQVQEKIEEAFW